MRQRRMQTVFSIAATATIGECIKALRRRHINAIPYPMPWEEGLSLWAPPEDVAVLMKAPSITACNYYNTELAVNINKYISTRLCFDWLGVIGRRPFIPKNPVLQRPELPQPILEWVDAIMEIKRDWARVQAVFDYFNTRAFNPRQIRYVWPSILGLLNFNDTTQPLGAKLADYQVPRGGVPSLPIEVKAAIKKTAQTIATGLILPDVGRPTDVVWLHIKTSHKWDEDGFVFSAL